MGKVEILEKEIESLSSDELKEFRRWFLEHDSAVWDQKIEDDISSRKLDSIADDALQSHKNGKSKEI